MFENNIKEMIGSISAVKSVQRGTVDQEFIEGNGNDPYSLGYQDYEISPINLQKSVLYITSFDQTFGTVPTSSSSFKSAYLPRAELVNNTTVRIYMTGFGKTGSSSGKSYSRIRCQWQVIEYN